MSITRVRTISSGELITYIQVRANSLGYTRTAKQIERLRRVVELDRCFAVEDGGRIVGIAQFNTSDISLPNGQRLACAACTGVGVLPTHRRRGFMTQLMRAGLDQARERGETLAALYSSEAPIYGRYGFGPAIPSVALQLDRQDTKLAIQKRTQDVDLVKPHTALKRYPEIYEAARNWRHGMIRRPPTLWQRRVGQDPEDERGDMSERFCALLGERGFATYRIRPHRHLDAYRPEMFVEDLIAVDAPAEHVLWQFLLGVDLVKRITAGRRPPDDLLPFAVANMGSVTAVPQVPLELRLLDVREALCRRGYDTTSEITLTVRDSFAPWNQATWLLSVSPEGASCTRTQSSPDIELDVRDLASIYMGGVRPSRLLNAGRLVECRPGAVAQAGKIFHTDCAPWNPTGF